jgi:nucleoside-diphosphate-sugar epimerase
MKILITGNMGYIGPLVIQRLRASYPNAALAGFDIGFFGNCITGADVLPECRVDMQYFGDIRRFPDEILNGVNAIVHLAGISNDPIGNRFEEVTLEINHRASVELARKAKENGVKAFVFASSCSLYGAADDAARTETSPLNPLTVYAKSKALTEQGLERLACDHFTITSLRFSTACGWSDRLRLDLVLNDFVASAIATGRITILSDGTPWRPLINVKDMARAVDWALARQPGQGGTYLAVNAGCDEWNYQVKELADAVARLIPGIEVHVNKDAQPDKRSYRVSFELFRKLAPAHQPRVTLAESVQELKAGLKAIRFKDKNFRTSRHMRLMALKELQEKGLLNEKLQWVQTR